MSRESGTTGETLTATLAAGTYYVRVEAREPGANAFTLHYGLSTPGTNQAPVFAEQSYAFDLAENADGALFGIELGPVVANDTDNDPITYSIVGGDPDGLFFIEAGTGFLLYVGDGEDYESGTTHYELTVRASDGSLHSDVTVTVNVTDVPGDVAPQTTIVHIPEQLEALGLSSSDDDYSQGVGQAGSVTVGGSATGEIETVNDRDWFAVDFIAGRSYRIKLEGSKTGQGTLDDPYLRGIFKGDDGDQDGNPLPGTSDDDGGEGRNAKVDLLRERVRHLLHRRRRIRLVDGHLQAVGRGAVRQRRLLRRLEYHGNCRGRSRRHWKNPARRRPRLVRRRARGGHQVPHRPRRVVDPPGHSGRPGPLRYLRREREPHREYPQRRRRRR